MIDGVIRAQQSHIHLLHIRAVAADDVHMLRRDFAQHVTEDVGQIGAAHHVVHKRLVESDQRVQVGAMQVGIVEEITLDARHFVKYLLPFGARIDVDLHRFGMQRSIRLARLRRFAKSRPRA